MKHLLLMIGATLCSTQAIAQGVDLLPRGIGAIQLGYREFAPQTHKYNADGKRELLGAPLSSSFDGQNLLQGKGGADLQKLAQELQKFDSYSQSPDSMINKLNLGEMQGDVRGAVSAQFLGVAYGISRRLNLFVAVPWVKAEVNAEINFTGSNNAQEIKNELGAVAFDELRVGLDRASAINTAQIKQSIESFGYAPLDQWSYQGVGDIMFGTNFGENFAISRRMNYHYVLATTVTLPTGYQDRPDILTDVAIGQGYYSLENKFTPRIEFFGRMSLGVWGSYKYNFPTTVERRVPEGDESLVDRSRQLGVDYTPGADYSAGFDSRFRYSSAVAAYRLGYQEHALDKYDGPVAGNYESLAEGSNMRQTFHEISVGLDTAKAYQQKRFAVPMILNATARLPITAYNSQDERYYEVSFTTFFATPRAKTGNSKEAKFAKKRAKTQTSRNLAH